MDYNATTPLEPEVVQVITEALQDAWGNPSSSYVAGATTADVCEPLLCDSAPNQEKQLSFFVPGAKAKAMISQSRESVARMVGGKAEDIVFTSGGTEVSAALALWSCGRWVGPAAAIHVSPSVPDQQPGVPYGGRALQEAVPSGRAERRPPERSQRPPSHRHLQRGASVHPAGGRAPAEGGPGRWEPASWL